MFFAKFCQRPATCQPSHRLALVLATHDGRRSLPSSQSRRYVRSAASASGLAEWCVSRIRTGWWVRSAERILQPAGIVSRRIGRGGRARGTEGCSARNFCALGLQARIPSSLSPPMRTATCHGQCNAAAGACAVRAHRMPSAGHLGVVLAYRGPACERLALQIFGVPEAVGKLCIPAREPSKAALCRTASRIVSTRKAQSR